MIALDINTVVKYLILLSAGLFGTKYKRKKKMEHLGNLLGKGKLTRHRIPINQIVNMLYAIIINFTFILNSINKNNYLLTIGFSIGAMINTAIIIYDLCKNRNEVLIYEYGIEVNNDEILYEKVGDYLKNDKDECTITRKWHRNICYKIIEMENIMDKASDDREEIFLRAFPELLEKKTKI